LLVRFATKKGRTVVEAVTHEVTKSSSKTDIIEDHKYNYMKFCVTYHLDPWSEDNEAKIKVMEGMGYIKRQKCPKKEWRQCGRCP
jgi:hypothetical protein